jgi:hypothetical protein
MVYEGLGSEYHIRTYSNAYENKSLALPVGEFEADETMLPATCVRKSKPGASATVRKRSRGE